MPKNHITEAHEINAITYWGMLVNILLSILKIMVGAIINSVALIADGIHSFSDLITDITVIISAGAARKPPDDHHPYGHGKFETIGTQIIGLILIIVGAGIARQALIDLYRHLESFPGPLVVIVALISVISKEILFQLTKRTAIKHNSTSLYANAWHHRSDALSSVAVLIGGIVSLFGFGHGDQIAGLVVGVMIIYVAVKIIAKTLAELTEHAIDEKLVDVIKGVLKNHEAIKNWHKLRSRKIGSEISVDVHIHVDPNLSVLESHNLTREIEQLITEKIKQPVHILIHVEPFREKEK